MALYTNTTQDGVESQSARYRTGKRFRLYKGGNDEDLKMVKLPGGGTRMVGAASGKVYAESGASGAIEYSPVDPVDMVVGVGAGIRMGQSLGKAIFSELTMGADDFVRAGIKMVGKGSLPKLIPNLIQRKAIPDLPGRTIKGVPNKAEPALINFENARLTPQSNELRQVQKTNIEEESLFLKDLKSSGEIDEVIRNRDIYNNPEKYGYDLSKLEDDVVSEGEFMEDLVGQAYKDTETPLTKLGLEERPTSNDINKEVYNYYKDLVAQGVMPDSRAARIKLKEFDNIMDKEGIGLSAFEGKMTSRTVMDPTERHAGAVTPTWIAALEGRAKPVKSSKEFLLTDAPATNQVTRHIAADNPNIVSKEVPVQYTEGVKMEKAPFDLSTGKFLQQEYQENLMDWYKSPEFARIMRQHHGDVDPGEYIYKTSSNVSAVPLIEDPSMVQKGASGTYYGGPSTKDFPIVTKTGVPMKTRVRMANKLERSDPESGARRAFVSDPGSTYHELGHQRTNSEELLPDFLRDQTANKKAFKGDPANEDYLTTGAEIEVRLQGVRRGLKETGINNYERPVSGADLDTFLEREGKASNTQMKKYKNELRRLNQQLSTKQMSREIYETERKKTVNLMVKGMGDKRPEVDSEIEEFLTSFSRETILEWINKTPMVAGVAVAGKSLYNANANDTP